MTDPHGDDRPSRWPCLRAVRGATVVDVLVAPNARRTALMGLHDGALRIRLAAPPVDSAANEVLLKWFAAELDLPKQAVTLLRGDTAKRKQLAIDLPLASVAAWLDACGA